jgi:hypothetical protein
MFPWPQAMRNPFHWRCRTNQGEFKDAHGNAAWAIGSRHSARAARRFFLQMLRLFRLRSRLSDFSAFWIVRVVCGEADLCLGRWSRAPARKQKRSS